MQGWLEGKELEVVATGNDIDDLREIEKVRALFPLMITGQGIYAILDEDHPCQDALAAQATANETAPNALSVP